MHRITQDRLTSGAAVALIHALIGYALLMGLIGRHAPLPEPEPRLIDIANPPPPPRAIPPRPVKPATHAGGRSHAREAPPRMIAAPPVVPLVTPAPPVPKPADGVSGTFDRPGTATSGEGEGFGNGRGSGYGEGEGDGFPPHHVRGKLKYSDYPHNAMSAGIGGTVGVRYRVNVDGHVSDCVVTASSGNAELDATTCRLIEERFRFDPARDEKKRPVASQIVETHTWEIIRDPDGNLP
jgi:periplasmic protein TonB